MAIEKWIAVTSLALFVMFAGEMLSVYNFMAMNSNDSEYFISFSADEKLIQFISIGAGPAGILAAVAFIMSRQYGSRPVGGMIIAGGVIMFIGLFVCYAMVDDIDERYITGSVIYVPILFMVLSAPTIVVGAFLLREKKRRPKKQYV
ncbi:MAG: hypothetical protein HRU07_04370 [Nitrosopumilus sp.]|nr:hypothetical protein [Nitrosopumilus sp.]NRA05388.1 hypothetical protein [Nitrosopumilus sp.]